MITRSTLYCIQCVQLLQKRFLNTAEPYTARRNIPLCIRSIGVYSRSLVSTPKCSLERTVCVHLVVVHIPVTLLLQRTRRGLKMRWIKHLSQAHRVGRERPTAPPLMRGPKGLRLVRVQPTSKEMLHRAVTMLPWKQVCTYAHHSKVCVQRLFGYILYVCVEALNLLCMSNGMNPRVLSCR